MTIPLFPTLTGRSWPIKRTPIWSSIRQTAASGRRSLLQMWTYPQYRYELIFSLLRGSPAHQEWQSLLGFFNQVAIAPGGVFRFTDPYDGQAADQAFGTGDGSRTAWQLARSLGGFTEPVFYPTSCTVKVSGVVNGGATLGSGGVVTFSSAPADGAALTWSGGFDWLCMFDDDSVDFQQDMPAFWQLPSLKFTTIKV